MLITPAGNPASSATSASMIPAETGANSDCFTTTVFPAATGDITARQDRTLAPFHGVKLATTPSGRRTPIEWEPGALVSRISPLGRNTQPATCWRVAATRSCWNVANEIVDPVSRASPSAISLRRRLTISAAFRNRRAFSAGGVSDHFANAFAAASTAIRASARDPAATRATLIPLYGSWTSKTALSWALRHSLSTKYLYVRTSLGDMRSLLRVGLDEFKHHTLDVSNNQVCAGWRRTWPLKRRCARRAQMCGVLGKRIDDERRAEVSERANIVFWPGDDGHATENRDFNPLFGDLEPFSDRLTRERLVSLDGGFQVM